MTFCRTISALALPCLLPNGVTAQQLTPSPPTGAVGVCTIVGQLLGSSYFGVAAGLTIADTSAVLLPDGRVRMYMAANTRGIVSAVSVTSAGDAFIPEAGERLPDGNGMPRVVVAATGGWRLYYTSLGGEHGRPEFHR